MCSSGENFMDWSHGAPPIALLTILFALQMKKYMIFWIKYLPKWQQLFPFEYIHVGGDECPKNFWEKSDAIKALMKKEELKNMEEVQSYFEKRVEKIVESKGKKFIGWDEILEGGLAPECSSDELAWNERRNRSCENETRGGDESDHFAYLDYMQGDAIIEPHVYATLRLNKAYQFEPVPEGVDAKYIKGGQANLWTEQVYNMRHANI